MLVISPDGNHIFPMETPKIPLWNPPAPAPRHSRRPQSPTAPWAAPVDPGPRPRGSGKPWENHGKTMGKTWENHGKPWEDHGLMGFNYV